MVFKGGVLLLHLHASWMIVGVVIDHTVSNNLLLADDARLLVGLKIKHFCYFHISRKVCKIFWFGFSVCILAVSTVKENVCHSLNLHLMTFGTESFVIFWKEFPIQLLLTAITSEAFLVKNFSKCCASIFRQLSVAMVTALWNKYQLKFCI